jgi:GAF domain-containing protein
VLRVTSSLPRFDEPLNRLLEEYARQAGEDVDTYVSRAVASRMVADQTQADSTSLDELLAHLSDAGVLTEAAMPTVSAVIADPERLRALRATGLLDSPPEEVYDRITRAAAAALDVPFAAMSLIDVDRQFLKSTVGMGGTSPEERQTTLERSVCQYAVANGAPLILEDARTDPVFKNHPAVVDGSLVAYLGIPLADKDGNVVGTLCVFDTKPRLWGTGHVQILGNLAELAAESMFASRPSPKR